MESSSPRCGLNVPARHAAQAEVAGCGVVEEVVEHVSCVKSVTDCAFGSIATPGSSGFEFETPTTVVVVRCGCEGLAKNVAG